MKTVKTLEIYLKKWVRNKPKSMSVVETILQIAHGSVELAKLLKKDDLAADDTSVKTKQDSDLHISMNVIADDIFFAALKNAPVAVVASEETDHVRVINKAAPLAVAIDPLDSSSNVNIDMTIGSIFAILPYQDSTDPELSFTQKGRHQLAAGFTLYGPQTLFVISVGSGTHTFIFDDASNRFILYQENMQTPDTSAEYAINTSNHRHWPETVRDYIDDSLKAIDGTFRKDFNTHKTASMVADVYRTLSHGGIHLYPGDMRPGLEQSRLRLVYEANPIAFLMQESGGLSTDGITPILDIQPESVHQRTPLVFGSSEQVKHMAVGQ